MIDPAAPYLFGPAKRLLFVALALPFFVGAQPAVALDRDAHLAHRMKFDLPTLSDNAKDEAPRVTLELGYGRAPPPYLGAAAASALPEEFGRPGRQGAIKAGLTFGF